MKIVVTQDLGLNQSEKAQLNQLGTVTYYDNLASTPEQWLERCTDANIICTGKFGLKQKYQELRNVFISLPFVDTGFLDPKTLKANHVTVSSCLGCNKDAVSEWIVAMSLNLFRDLPSKINNLKPITKRQPSIGLSGKTATILGPGAVGSRVGKILKVLDMKVNYFDRGDNLSASVKNADLIIDTLATNSETTGLLGPKFFSSLKTGSFFVTVTSSAIWNADALYQKLAQHPKILATPHIAYNTDTTDRTANQMMIKNIASHLDGKTINQVSQKGAKS